MVADTILSQAVKVLIDAKASQHIIDGLGRYCSDLTVDNFKLEKEKVALLKQIALLTAQNNTLELENAELRGENKALKEQAEAAGTNTALESDLHRKMLKYIFDLPTGPMVGEVAKAFGLKENEVRYHAETLISGGLITLERIIGMGGNYYSITAEGRRFVINNGL